MRRADLSDLNQIAACAVELSRYVRQTSNDPYAQGLPTAVSSTVLEAFRVYVESPEAFALLVESGDRVEGCLAGRTGRSSFPAGCSDLVGQIDLCWVHQDVRGSGIGRRLAEAAEQLFRERDVSAVELSWLAGNSLAADVWNHLGYTPFRVTAWKPL